MQTYVLDKRLATNTDYTTEGDVCLVIKKIGTNSTTKLTAKVAGAPCGDFIDAMGALTKTSSNKAGLFDLGDLYIVVPPDKTFRFDGASGAYVRIYGDLIRLGPNEAIPAALAGRYAEQASKFYTFYANSLTSTVTLAAGASSDLISFEVSADEKLTFNNYLMAKYLVGGAIDYEVTTRIAVQDAFLDNLLNSKVPLGITQAATPYPPNSTDGEEVLTFKDRPFEAKAGNSVKLQIYNTGSGSKDVQPGSKALIVAVKEYI
jgi:hypothetical protein